ncbi:unnamed protein product [Heligmosomoides polygyrus]|uniref:Uncharacterized protein n=1 Tax=Heligmosomoides polygyrus TaxID=6339 RepID=A0A183GU15_HELPZ|nr:unnamed protein product [Heligmosomoides polygyrus]
MYILMLSFDYRINVRVVSFQVNTVQIIVLREHEGEILTDNRFRQLVMERFVELVPEQRWNQLYAEVVVYLRLLRTGARNGAVRPYP